MLSHKSIDTSIFIKLLAAALFYLELQPYFVWKFTGTPLLIFVTLPLVIIMITHVKNRNEIIAATIFGFIALTASISEGSNIWGSISFSIVATLFLCVEYLRDVYFYFKKIYVILILLSMVAWILILSGISLPSNLILPLNTLKDHMYIQYPFLVIPEFDADSSIYDIIRFCGLFDEPGVVGTIAFLMLVIDGFNLRVPSNAVIFISGLFSMSLFFYLGSFLYAVYFIFITKGESQGKIANFIFLTLLIIISYNIDMTHDAIWDRLEYDEAKGFTGNNRAAEDLKLYIDQIRWTDAYWFGVHDDKIIKEFSGSASIQNAILKYGVIGCILYALFFIVYIYRSKGDKTDAIFCIIFLFLTLWQRPGLYSIPYVFLYLIMIKNFGESTISKDEKKISTY